MINLFMETKDMFRCKLNKSRRIKTRMDARHLVVVIFSEPLFLIEIFKLFCKVKCLQEVNYSEMIYLRLILRNKNVSLFLHFKICSCFNVDKKGVIHKATFFKKLSILLDGMTDIDLILKV